MKVLLVDQSFAMHTLKKWCLNKLGVDAIASTTDGVEALAEFDRECYDLVLADWDLAKLDGLTVLKEVRRRNATVPVIITVGEAQRSEMAAAVRAGCSDYLVKPFSPTVLRQKLEKWVGART